MRVVTVMSNTVPEIVSVEPERRGRGAWHSKPEQGVASVLGIQERPIPAPGWQLPAPYVSEAAGNILQGKLRSESLRRSLVSSLPILEQKRRGFLSEERWNAVTDRVQATDLSTWPVLI